MNAPAVAAMSVDGWAAERDERRRQRQRALLREWQSRNEARLKRRPPAVQGCLTLLAHREADRLARNGAAGPLRLAAETIELEMRRLVTQLRRQRHGALEQVDAATWNAQVGAIAAELGWQWTAPQPVASDNPARKLRGLEAAHAIGIALILFAAPPSPQSSAPQAPSPSDAPTLADLLEA